MLLHFHVWDMHQPAPVQAGFTFMVLFSQEHPFLRAHHAGCSVKGLSRSASSPASRGQQPVPKEPGSNHGSLAATGNHGSQQTNQDCPWHGGLLVSRRHCLTFAFKGSTVNYLELKKITLIKFQSNND